jgi:hypothetical protein
MATDILRATVSASAEVHGSSATRVAMAMIEASVDGRPECFTERERTLVAGLVQQMHEDSLRRGHLGPPGGGGWLDP